MRERRTEALYRYATSEAPEHGWTKVDGDSAVHAMCLSDPEGMLATVEGRVTFV